jgi:hypothetical protein
MTEVWSRRQLLKRAGTAAAGAAGFSAAGLSLAGCGTRAPARALADSTVLKGVRYFQSRPDLQPPLVELTTNRAPGDPGYIFLATAALGPGQGGTMILRTDGELVWFKPDVDISKFDFNVQAYLGKPVLTWWQGHVLGAGYGDGIGVIADSKYQTIHTVKAGNGLKADLHEFELTPQGTALITAYRQRTVDLTSVGGPASGQLVSGVAQEIDIATGKLLFEWDSWDHVPLEDTYQPFKYQGKVFGTKYRPFDYFHINSLTLDADGDILISSRNTWCVYKVSRTTGKIIWRMNGKKSDFTFGPGARFYWQHHVREPLDNVITVFDNGANPDEEKRSRAIVLDVDLTKKHVTLRNQYVHPGAVLLSDAEGSAQLRPDGRMFVGWGTHPYFSEFAPDGKLLLDGQITKGDASYRAFIADWTGYPLERPAISAQSRPNGTAVFASWNGATDVAWWTILAGSSAFSSLSPAGTMRRTDFETGAVVSSTGPFFAVQAHDSAGRPLAQSATVHVIAGTTKFNPVNGGCGEGNNCGY